MRTTKVGPQNVFSGQFDKTSCCEGLDIKYEREVRLSPLRGGRGPGKCCHPPWRPPIWFPLHQRSGRSGRGKKANQIALGLNRISVWSVGFNFPWVSFSKTLDSYPLIFSGAALISPHLAISKLGIAAIPQGLAEHICRYLTITRRLSFFLLFNVTSKLHLLFYGSAQINFLLIMSCLRRGMSPVLWNSGFGRVFYEMTDYYLERICFTAKFGDGGREKRSGICFSWSDKK